MAEKKIALVTGGNRGLGLETCRQLAEGGTTVLLGSRNIKAGEKAAAELRNEGLEVTAIQLDVTRPEQIRKAYQLISGKLGRLDILVNNAGVFLDTQQKKPGFEEGTAFLAKLETLRKSFETNTLSAFEMNRVFIPLMLKNRYGRVVNVSSGMGQLTEMNGTSPGYRLSKTALNAVTRIFADETKGKGVLVNSVCPGWVKTRMGGKEAELTPEQGVKTIVWLATLPASGPTGGFFRNNKRIPW